MPTPSEFDIQRAFVIWFQGILRKDGTWSPAPAKMPGVVGWHTPNGGARSGLEAKRFKEMGVLAGIPDYFMLWGTLYALEFKKPGGRLSGAQIEMHPRLLAAGAIVHTVDNLDDAKRFCRDNGLTAC